MTVEEFFELFLKELNQNTDLQFYYKFLGKSSSFNFRKAYFIQRLQYIADQIDKKDAVIWDCGCGYGTTCLFLAMNGYKTVGSTLEFYYNQIEKRKDFWGEYGDVSLFTANYENIFDNHPSNDSIDYVILQDTLHHLEPIQQALSILKNSLKKEGKILVSEVNGNNYFERTRFFIQRGNKRIIEIWDEKLQKNILLGNENIRSLKVWRDEFIKHDLVIHDNKVKYIRFYLPFNYNDNNINDIILKEQKIWKKHPFLKEYLFFGLNFVANKLK